MATQFFSLCMRLSTSKGDDLNSSWKLSASLAFLSSASMVYSGVPPSP